MSQVKFKQTVTDTINGAIPNGGFAQGAANFAQGAFPSGASGFAQGAANFAQGAMPPGAAGFAQGAANFAQGAMGQGQRGPHDESLRHRFGEAITKGEGAGGYLQAYLKQLEKNPLRTKMLTSGSLAGLQEVLASWIAQDRNKNGHYFTSRVPKMAAYGALVSAPLGHFMIKLLQFLFANRTSLKAKIMQIVVSNLIVSISHAMMK